MAKRQIKACVARDGTRMANCGNGIHRPIYIGGLYELKPRTRDGVKTWRRVGSFGDTNTYLSDRYIDTLRTEAERQGWEWESGNMWHGKLDDAEQARKDASILGVA